MSKRASARYKLDLLKFSNHEEFRNIYKWISDFGFEHILLYYYYDSDSIYGYRNDILASSSFSFFTPDIEFNIIARKYTKDSYNFKTYMAGFAAARRKKPGEINIRGNDIGDGPISEDTWNRMIKRMLLTLFERLSYSNCHFTAGSISDFLLRSSGGVSFPC